MPTIRLRNSHSDIEISADTEAEVQALYREVIKHQHQPAPAVPAADVLRVRDDIEAASGLSIRPVEVPATVVKEPVSPRSESDSDTRDRQREAAARAREALAEKRRAQAEDMLALKGDYGAKAKAKAEPEAAKARRGRLPKEVVDTAGDTTPVDAQDLTGDPEESDQAPDPDTEPQDYADRNTKPPNGSGTVPPVQRTPDQMRQICLESLQDVANLGDTSKAAVKLAVQAFGVTKIRDVPAARLDEFWAATASICTKYNVPFPPAPAH